MAARALGETFTAYGVELERVESFQYLGRTLRYNDNDAQAISHNIRKARAMWGRLSRVMRKENASPRGCGLFYKATVQAILLFGSETWTVTPSSLQSLEGFHIRAARRMPGMMPQKAPGGQWVYPVWQDVLKTAGLYSIGKYVEVRRATILCFVEQRPIYDLCREAERQRG